ncbi:MAG: hypothetical protein ACE5L7_03520 [Candidatus Aminicenantales bacterium]
MKDAVYHSGGSFHPKPMVESEWVLAEDGTYSYDFYGVWQTKRI